MNVLQDVYEQTTKHLVDNVLAGYNATVFAYGATGGGKTYTMVGAPDKPGIMVSAGFAGQTELNTSLE